MLRKILSLGALVVVALAFGVGNAAAKSGPPGANHGASPTGFSDGRLMGADPYGFSDGRD
jgi:hypothetical protein